MTAGIETVHIIFKTHLDLGFTDLAQKVVAKYFDEYFPRALETSERLRQAAKPERFIWTTGSWLIYEYLEKASPQNRRRIEAAIEAGDITWHGLPFTMHSELMDAALFKYGLSLSQALDRRFGKNTIAAKMTDVPGHTRAIVPLLAEAGLKFLHIGVNEASTPPAVPPVFVWQDANGAEVIVMYQHSYGELMVVPGMAQAITFAHTHDNLGPQSTGQVIDFFNKIRAQFPQTNVIASTLDAYAQALMLVESQLPVITDEIGDTWIHGVGTDPKKVSQFRELCRLRNRWLTDQRISPDDKKFTEFSRSLLLVSEHTWGLDEKTHLADYENYSREHFDAIRGTPPFKKLVASWAEQRANIDQAVNVLGDSSLAGEAHHHLKAIEPAIPNKDGFEKVAEVSRFFDTARFVLRFDPTCGAIAYLVDKTTRQRWASADHPLGLVRYQTFSQADYDRFLSQYVDTAFEWAVPDFSKPGMAEAEAEGKWWNPGLSELFVREDEEGHYFILEMGMPEKCTSQYGCPKLLTLEIVLPRQEPSIVLNLQWFQKPANRLPEAFWFSFCPQITDAAGWLMEKMGKHISPLEVVRNGNRKLHAVEKGVSYRDRENELVIETLDAPLVAPGEPSLLNFNNEQPPLEKGMHFNLYNNIWGTNFPMWYDEDARFRFVLRFPPKKA